VQMDARRVAFQVQACEKVPPLVGFTFPSKSLETSDGCFKKNINGS
jgi:hypothetical protein